MAATPYDVTPTETIASKRERRPRTVTIRVGKFGGMLGLAVVAVGLLVIGIGWNGMAGAGGQVNHVSDLRAQLPWLLSGGFLGLGIIVVGAALVIVQSAREDRARLERKLDEVVRAFGQPAAVPGQAGASTISVVDRADLVVAGAASYHKPTCRLVEGRDESDRMTPGEAAAHGLVACRVCKPAAAEQPSNVSLV